MGRAKRKKKKKKQRQMLKLKASKARATGVNFVNVTALTLAWMSSFGDKRRALKLGLPKSRVVSGGRVGKQED